MGSIPHNSDSLDFKIDAQVATATGSGTIGIRDISLIFVNDSSVTSTNSCFRLFDTQLTGLAGECQCPKGSYYNSGTCSSCDPSCGDCFGPSSSQCYSCVSGYSWTGTSCIQCDSSCVTCSGPSNNQCLTCPPGYWHQKNGTCTSSCNLPTSASQTVGVLQVCETICQDPEYLLWDGSCATSCPSPLVASVLDSNLLCNKPCQTGEFFDYNGDCVSSCSSPYVQASRHSVDMCNLPCEPASEYLYPNGSCDTSCSSPLVSTVSGGIQWCDSSCGTDYTYSDYSCDSQCNSPLLASSVMGINYCDSPCGTTGWINPNGSCRAQCDTPLVSTAYNSINWCSSPCGYSEYYYPNDNSCQTSCSSPSIIEDYDLVYVCSSTSSSTSSTSSTLTTAHENTVDQASSVTSGAGKTAQAGTAASSLVSSGSPNAITLIALMKMLEYMRYMNINYPPKLDYFLDGQSEESISLNFDVDLPEKIQEEFPDYPLPGKFGDYDLSSSFIVNYWQELLTCLILFTILGFAIVMAFYTKKVKYVGNFFIQVKTVIQWNLMLIVICSNMDSVGVYSSLELRTTPFNSFLSVLGTLICVLVNLVAVFLMGFTLWITYSLHRSRKRVSPSQFNGPKLQETDEKYLKCGVLYLNFRQSSLLQSSSMFFLLLRIYLFNMVIGYLFDYPLAQAILIFLMSFMMLTFLCFQRPYKKTYDLIKTITYESIIFVVNICILTLAVMDHRDVYMVQERARLGDVIIFANVFFNVVAVLFFGVDVARRLIKAYKISKKVKSRGLKFWTKILVTLFEPEDMEDVSEEQAKKKHAIKKERIIIKNLEAQLDLEKSSQICLKNAKTALTISSPHEVASSIGSFEGLGEVGSRKNLLSSPQNAGSTSSLEQDTSACNLERRRIPRPSLLNRSPFANQTQPSLAEVDSIKLPTNEDSASRTPTHPHLKEEKETVNLPENVFEKSVFKNRRKIKICPQSHSSDDHLKT